MEIVGMIIFVIGGIVSLIGGIWFLVVAFRQGILWGIGCIILPIVALVFLIMYWGDTVKPFFVSLLGAVLLFIAAIMMPGMMPGR